MTRDTTPLYYAPEISKTGILIGSDLFGGLAGFAFSGSNVAVGVVVGLGCSIYAWINLSDGYVALNPNTYLGEYGPDIMGFGNVDMRDPINPCYDLTPINDAIGVEVGLYHNFIITQLLTNDAYSCDISNHEELVNQISLVINDYDLVVTDQVGYIDSQELVCILSQINLPDNITDLQQEITNFNEFVGSYYNIAIRLNPASLFDYTNQFSNIIDEAWRNGELSEEEALLINGSISVGYYSSCLWRPYLSSPLNSEERVIYNEYDNEVYFCNREELVIYINQHQNLSHILIGIPHYVHGELAEVYFYKQEMEEYYGQYEGIENRLVSINQETTYFASSTSYGYTLPIGEYQLLEVPASDQSIYYIKVY